MTKTKAYKDAFFDEHVLRHAFNLCISEAEVISRCNYIVKQGSTRTDYDLEPDFYKYYHVDNDYAKIEKRTTNTLLDVIYYKNSKTEVSVTANEEDIANKILEVFDKVHANSTQQIVAVDKEGATNAIINNQDYRLSKQLTTVSVDRGLLKYIENYCFKKVPVLLNISEEEIRRVYKTKIKDGNGTQTFDIIDNYSLLQFPNSTEQIVVGFDCRDRKNKCEYSVFVKFSSENCQIDIQIESGSPREMAIGVLGQLEVIIGQKRTMNHLFHLSVSKSLLLVLVGFSSVVGGLTLVMVGISDKIVSNIKIGAMLLIISVSSWSYLLIIPKLKPYSSFDTNEQSRNDKIANYFLLGIVSFLLFGTLLVSLKNWLIF